MTDSTPRASLQPLIISLSIALPILALLLLGQDGNWDLQNYHLYNPFAWLNDRLQFDIAPAQRQSWHNPLLDVPIYWLTRAGAPGVVTSIWLTLPLMVSLVLLTRLHALLAVTAPRWLPTTILIVLAVTGAAAWSEVGTCFNDAFVSAGMLGSLYLVLREEVTRDRSSIWCAAGVIAGAVVGLKLTAGGFALGLAAAAFAFPSPMRLPRRLGALLLGGLVGFALTYAYWGWLIYHLHGNPLFPYFNQIFQSPDAEIASYSDTRFLPTSFVEMLLVPVRLLISSTRFTEVPMRDPRLLLGIAFFAFAVWKRRRNNDRADAGKRARLHALVAFFAVSYVFWIAQSAIYRYALPLELLSSLAIVLLIDYLPSRWRDACGILLVGLIMLATVHPSFGRSPFRTAFVEVQMPPLPPDAMVVISSRSPLAYAVTALPRSVPAISIASENNLGLEGSCTRLLSLAEQRIRHHVGPLWLLRADNELDDPGQQHLADSYGLIVESACLPIGTSMATLRLCPLRRESRPVRCSPIANVRQ